MATYRSRTWLCPDCGGTFSFLHTVTDGIEEGPPDFCPKCGSSMTEEPIVLPSSFKIGTHKGKSGDDVFRAMEDASDHRAQLMADQLGLDKSEFSHTKITNLRDNLRPGDQAALLPPNPVSQMMQALPSQTGNNTAAGIGYAQATQTGPGAGRHGHSTRTVLQEHHQQTTARVASEGRLNKK